jgi:peptide/nickel transport system substrate-binding protein
MDVKNLKMKAFAVAATVALVTTTLGGFATTASAAGKVLVVDSTFNHKTLDPGREFEPGGNLIDRALYSTLMTFTGNDASTPVPDIALSFKASVDAKVFTYKLRKNAKFSDGTKVTSKDVVFSFMRLKNLKGNPASLMDGITATAPNAYTVVLTSDTSNTAIPVIVCSPSLGIVNSAAVKREGGLSDASAAQNDKAEIYLNTTSAGSGPYLLKRFSLTSEVDLVANPRYWGSKPKYSKIVIRNTLPQVQLLDVQKGVAQIAMDLSPKQTTGLSALKVTGGVSTTVWFLLVNSDSKVSTVTSDPNFQKAVRLGVDYSKLVKFAGTGTIQAAGIIPSAFLGALKSADAVKRDLVAAKAALAKSSYKGEAIPLSYWGGGAWEGILFDDFAAEVQAQLKEVGISITLAPASIGDALNTYRAGTEAMGLWFWGPDWPDSSNYTQNFSPGNKVGLRAGWVADANPAVTTLVNNVAVEPSAAKRLSDYRNYQLALNQNSPFVPLIQSPVVRVSAKSVKGLAANPIWEINLSDLK